MGRKLVQCFLKGLPGANFKCSSFLTKLNIQNSKCPSLTRKVEVRKYFLLLPNDLYVIIMTRYGWAYIWTHTHRFTQKMQQQKLKSNVGVALQSLNKYLKILHMSYKKINVMANNNCIISFLRRGIVKSLISRSPFNVILVLVMQLSREKIKYIHIPFLF